MNDSSKSDDTAAARPPKDTSNPMPSAGPHDKPELINPDATPGAGSLPSTKTGGDADSGTG